MMWSFPVTSPDVIEDIEKDQLMEEKGDFSSNFKGTAHHGRKGKLAGG